jgi:hypothetical protein
MGESGSIQEKELESGWVRVNANRVHVHEK